MMGLLGSFLPWYLLFINLAALLLYGRDKSKARRDRWRTPESVLLGVAALGGGAGALLGMGLFHHKTRKGRFRVLVPLFCLLWIGLLVRLFLLGTT